MAHTWGGWLSTLGWPMDSRWCWALIIPEHSNSSCYIHATDLLQYPAMLRGKCELGDDFWGQGMPILEGTPQQQVCLVR